MDDLTDYQQLMRGMVGLKPRFAGWKYKQLNYRTMAAPYRC